METKKHISEKIFRAKNMTMMIFFIVTLFFNYSCTNKQESNSGQENKAIKNDTLLPPVSVIITNPTTILLDTCPSPEQISIPTSAANKTIKLKNGAFLKLEPLVTKPADFLSIMQNYTTDKGLALDAIACSIMDKTGNLWFGTFGGGVSRYDGKSFTNFTTLQGLANNTVQSIAEDKMGNLWFGSYGGSGVSRYDGKSFTTFTTAQGLANNTVWWIMADKMGYLWFGTGGGGVSRYNGKSFTNFTTTQGLANNTVWSIAEDKIGNIWFGSGGGGVSRYDGNRIEAIERGDKIAQLTQQDLKKINGKLVKSFTNFTTVQGLADNRVRSIIEDKTGNLWFGTSGGGVSRYDGKTFTNFSTAQGLVNNSVWSITEDKMGNIWIGTYDGGISRYDGNCEATMNINKKNVRESRPAGQACFTNFTTSQGLANNGIRSITKDKTGNLWFGTYGGGVSRYDGKSFTNFTKLQGMANNTVRSIMEDRTGNLWFGTDGNGVLCYAGKSFIHFTMTQGLPENTVLSIAEDKKGNLWFGTDGGGVSRYDGNRVDAIESGNTIVQQTQKKLKKTNGKSVKSLHAGLASFTNFNTTQGLANNTVWNITEDKKGNLWFGTNGGGVSLYDGKTFTNFTTAQGLANNMVLSITEDKTGNLWFGTYDGGVSRYDGKSFTNFTMAQGLPNNTVFCITEDKTGNLWFGTYGGGVSRFDGKSFTNFTKAEGLPDNIVTQVLITKEQDIAIGTNFGVAVLKKFSPRSSEKGATTEIMPAQNRLNNEELKNYTPVFEIFNSEMGYPVKDVNQGQNTLFKDNKGIIWIATGADQTGLVRFDYASLNKNIQPPKVFIQSIKINNENISWYNLSSSNNSRSIAKKNSDSYTTPSNVTEEVTTFGRILSDKERKTMRHKFGKIQFDSITKFYSLPENLVLPYENNNVTFDFAAIEPAKPYLVRYQYILEGYDKDWSPITNKNTASFGNISDGTYTFKVKAQFTGLTAKGAEGWSEPITYTFKVLPPWWRTWWMYSIDSFAVLLSLFGIYRWRTASLRKDKEILEQTVIERTTELQKSTIELKAINKELEAFSYTVSHDLRAPLRAINGYSKILEDNYASKLDNDGVGFLNAIGNNSKKMGELIDDLLSFSKLGRTEMTTSEIDMSILVKSVIEEETIGNSNEIEFMVKELLPSKGTQTLLKQVWINLISNAIKYSKHKPKPSIEIGSYYKDNLVVYYVKDNGAGFDMQYYDKLFGVFQRLHSQDEFEGTGIGLAIVQKIINRHNGTVWAESKLGEGSCFYFSLPAIK
jgi:ligand-binding sensor domain-containing protein/signal transduction histidine kinase